MTYGVTPLAKRTFTSINRGRNIDGPGSPCLFRYIAYLQNIDISELLEIKGSYSAGSSFE